MGRAFLRLLGLIALLVAPAAGAEPSREYAIKAAFLYKFGDYVDWPPSVFTSPDSPFFVCVIGTDPFGAVLDDLARGERAAGHPIVIKRAATLDESTGCHVAYVSAADKTFAQSLGSVAGKPVLTVTDGVDELGPHGIVNFIIRDNRVRFDIDTRLTAESGLTISSKLLSVAAMVRVSDNAKENAP